MNEKYNVYLVSDSTGETLDRIFLSLKSQFANFEYEKKEFAFVRTEQQIDKIISDKSKQLKILEVGADNGSFLKLIKEKNLNSELYAIEPNNNMHNQLKNITEKINLNIILLSIHHLPIMKFL